MIRKRYNTYDFNSDSAFVPMTRCCSTDVVIDADSIQDSLHLQMDGVNDTIKGLKEELDKMKNCINKNVDHKSTEIKKEINSVGHCVKKVDSDIKEIKDRFIHNTSIVEDITKGIDKLFEKIHHSERHIIHEIEENSLDDKCFCHLATKKDVEKAVTDINMHTTEVVDELNIDELFEDLNNQLKQ